MKFKIILLASLLISLNLYGFEPMMPGRAYEKASDDYGQVDTISMVQCRLWC